MTLPSFAPDAWLRIPIYVAFGIVSEVLFTAIWDLIHPGFIHSWSAKGDHRTPKSKRRPSSLSRDPRAMGYTFLWMVPIYMALVFMEPLSASIDGWPLVLRGLLYLGLIWTIEYIGGWLIEKATGHIPWDYWYSKYSLHGHIRWDFALFWFIFGLLAESLSKKLILLTPAIKSAFFS